MDKSLRIKANVGKDQVVRVNMKQNVDIFEVLSLELSQQDAYKVQASNYGVIVGRILANDAFGVPNAKVSVFIPLTDEDELDNGLVSLYPYKTTTNVNNNGIRYNLLPTYSSDDCYTKVGTFPSKRAVLDNDAVLEVYDKYYKYTATTNKAGDYMIFGVPTGNTQIHVDVDLSDIGILSQKPRDFVYKGYNINQFESPTKFKSGTNLDNLAQIYSQDETVHVYPFWGDDNSTEVAITRKDISLQYEFNTTCVFLGSAVTDSKNNSISHECDIDANAGEMSQLVASEGTIEMIRKTPYGNVEEFSIQGNQLIDSDGVWCYQIPMNLDYVGMDEYGNIVPTNNPTKGIPTRARVRFRISLNESGTDTLTRHKAKFLVPNNPLAETENNTTRRPVLSGDYKSDYDNFYAFGSDTPDICFRDLLWNNVYTVKSYIPRVQKNSLSDYDYYSGIKGVNKKNAEDKNAFPYNKLKLKYNVTTAGIFRYIKDNFNVNDINFWYAIRQKTLLPNVNSVLESVMEENDGISLDFYNDWINGVLYFPLWFWRVRKKNKSKKGEISYDSRFCSSNYSPKKLYNVSTCDLPYLVNDKDNDDINSIRMDLEGDDYDEVPNVRYDFFDYTLRLILSTSNLSLLKDKKTEYDRTPTSLPLSKGLIVEKSNKDNARVYYYSNSEKKSENGSDVLVRLYSTDIVLLGSLTDNDINGIPQIQDFYPITSANIPPMGSYKPIGSYEASGATGNVKDDIKKVQELEKKDNSSITGMHWGYGDDVVKKTTYTYVEDKDGHVKEIPKKVYVTDENGMILSRGLFFGTMKIGNWFTSYTLPKSCINVERICELGVSLDMSTLNENGNNITLNNFGKHDGLITKREIEDEYSRQFFATLNQSPLVVSSDNINHFTGYNTYPIKYCCPTDFDGKMSSFIKKFTNGYSHDDESLEYESFRFGGYKEYKFNYMVEDSNKIDYYFPFYNNSFYFYFGLNQGQTAIEKFKKQFFDECKSGSELPFDITINLLTNPTLCNPNGGTISVTTNDAAITCIKYTISNVYGLVSEHTNEAASGLAVGTYDIDVSAYTDCHVTETDSFQGKLSTSIDISYATPLLSLGVDVQQPTEKDGVGSFQITSVVMYGKKYTDIQKSGNMMYVGGIDNFYVRYDLFDSNGQNITADDESNNGVKFINLKVGEYILHAQELCKDNESGEKFTPIGDVSTKTIFIKFSEK